MSHILMQYWRALSSRGTVAHAGTPKDEWPNDAATRAEQLEDITIYARAGYFDMGYTADAFQLPSN